MDGTGQEETRTEKKMGNRSEERSRGKDTEGTAKSRGNLGVLGKPTTVQVF